MLEAALRNNLLLKYGCKHGGCGTCKVRLLDGDVDEHGSSFALTADDRADDLILACASVPLEPCVIDVGAQWADRGGVLLRGQVPGFDATVAASRR